MALGRRIGYPGSFQQLCIGELDEGEIDGFDGDGDVQVDRDEPLKVRNWLLTVAPSPDGCGRGVELVNEVRALIVDDGVVVGFADDELVKASERMG